MGRDESRRYRVLSLSDDGLRDYGCGFSNDRRLNLGMAPNTHALKSAQGGGRADVRQADVGGVHCWKVQATRRVHAADAQAASGAQQSLLNRTERADAHRRTLGGPVTLLVTLVAHHDDVAAVGRLNCRVIWDLVAGQQVRW